jgi:enamine deaminase RidA (YjgF/YER057c/UK114 family)
VTVERTAINPVTWSVEMGFNQGELVSGHTRTLYCSGQTAMSQDGTPQHEGDMAAQVALSLDNLEAVLAEAGMTLENLVGPGRSGRTRRPAARWGARCA